MRWAFFGGIAGVAIAGCTLLVDTDGLEGGPKAAAEPEAGVVVVDAGLPDVTSEVAPAEASVGVCPPNPIICDDFESGMPGLWELHVNGSGAGDLITDPALAHRGQRAFRATSKTDDTVANSEAELRVLPAQVKKSGATIYFRAYVFMPGPFFHDTTLSKWRTPANTDDDLNLKVDLGGHVIVDADNAGAGTELKSDRTVKTGEWFCLDWRATLGTPGHEVVLINGDPFIDADDVNVTSNGYNAIGIGFVAAEADHDISVLFDDVIISETLVGCP